MRISFAIIKGAKSKAASCITNTTLADLTRCLACSVGYRVSPFPSPAWSLRTGGRLRYLCRQRTLDTPVSGVIKDSVSNPAQHSRDNRSNVCNPPPTPSLQNVVPRQHRVHLPRPRPVNLGQGLGADQGIRRHRRRPHGSWNRPGKFDHLNFFSNVEGM